MSAPFFAITRGVFLWTRLLNVPFWCICNLLPFILYLDLHATPWQVALTVAVKPLSSCLSFFWGAALRDRRDRLRQSLITAHVFKYLPFLAFPWMDNVWGFIAAYACYMSLLRGAVPGWIEIIKLNSAEKQRDTVFATGSVIDYAGGAVLPLLLGWQLDHSPEAWRWIFFGAACLGIASTLLLYRLPTPVVSAEPSVAPPASWHSHIIGSLRASYQLVRQHRDFARFQFVFMLGGTGLILVKPAASAFFIDQLHLSYTQIAIAQTICTGFGFATTTPLWVKAFHRLELFRFSCLVSLLAALYPFCLLASLGHQSWFYIAHILYGCMQAGSELSWHMSAPIFAREQDSSLFTSTAMLAAGLRGACIPLLGAYLFTTTGIVPTLVCAALCSLLATYTAWQFRSIAAPAFSI